MSWNTVHLGDTAPMPWKNGGGVTRELLAWPDAGGWQVRVSVAEVAKDGPFSRYEGVQRWFAVLHGAGVRLVIDGQAHELTPASEPLAFGGEAPVQCSLLGGATEDFNLMTRNAPATLARVRGSRLASVAGGTLVAAWAARPAVLTLGAQQTRLAPATLAWQYAPAAAVIAVAGDDVLWMEVTP